MSFLRDPQIERNVNRLPITFDSHGVDRFGVDKEWLIRAYSPFAHMYRSYLNVTTFGMLARLHGGRVAAQRPQGERRSGEVLGSGRRGRHA